VTETISPIIAKTVQRVASLRNRLAKAVTNRNIPLSSVTVEKIIAKTQFGYHGRRPLLPLNKKGQPRDTDMDLFSFLVGLQKREAVLRLPSYQNKLPRTVLSNEEHMCLGRFGTLTDLIAHKDQLSFGVRLFDHTIVRSDAKLGRESIGAYRTFMMVNYQGLWHEGWKGASWKYANGEEVFAKRYQLPVNACMRFKYYVHPHRRESIFGAPYLLLKLLSMRLNDEIAFYQKEIKRLETEGWSGHDVQADVAVAVTTPEVASEMVQTFKVALEGILLSGFYNVVASLQEEYDSACAHLHHLRYELLPRVQFICRADEVAFYHFGMEQGYTAPWVRKTQWVAHESSDSYRTSSSIKLTSTFGLTYRTDTVSQKVAG
jgi:hypothetical protein